MDAEKQVMVPEYTDQDYSADQGAGLADAPNQVYPRIRMMAATNPDAQKKDSKLYGKKPGTIYCPEADLYADSVIMVPCLITTSYAAWEHNDGTDAMPVAVYHDRPAEAKWYPGDGLKLPSGLYVVENHTYYTIIWIDGVKTIKSRMIFSRTSLKVSREFVSRLLLPITSKMGQKTYVPPIYARAWHVEPMQKVESNRAWHTWKIHDKPYAWLSPDSDLYGDARAYMHEATKYAETLKSVPAEQAIKAASDDDIPF